MGAELAPLAFVTLTKSGLFTANYSCPRLFGNCRCYAFSGAFRLCSINSFCKSASDLDWEVPSTVFSAMS